jgi:hypothetical protein
VVNPVKTTGAHPLVDTLHREPPRFELLQRDQPLLPVADLREFSITPVLMGRKLHPALSFRPINTRDWGDLPGSGTWWLRRSGHEA